MPQDWLPANLNRAYCLMSLQRDFRVLTEPVASRVRARLEALGAWSPLWQVEAPDIGFDPLGAAPFLTHQNAWAPGAAPRRGGKPVHDGAAR